MKVELLLAALALGNAIAGPAMTDRVTPEEIAARQKTSPLAALQTPSADAAANVERPGEQSIIKQSDILHDGLNWTLVPKGAVLHVPVSLAIRVGAKPVGTLLSWRDFLTANRAWLFTEEVTFDQAAGKKPLLPSRGAAWEKNGKLVVAVHQGGPISVRTEIVTPVASTP